MTAVTTRARAEVLASNLGMVQAYSVESPWPACNNPPAERPGFEAETVTDLGEAS